MSVQPLISVESSEVAGSDTLRAVPVHAGRKAPRSHGRGAAEVRPSVSSAVHARPLRLVRTEELVRPERSLAYQQKLDVARSGHSRAAIRNRPALPERTTTNLRTVAGQRTGFDVAFNIAVVTIIAMALLVLGIVLAFVSSPEAGGVISASTGQVAMHLPTSLSSTLAAFAG